VAISTIEFLFAGEYGQTNREVELSRPLAASTDCPEVFTGFIENLNNRFAAFKNVNIAFVVASNVVRTRKSTFALRLAAADFEFLSERENRTPIHRLARVFDDDDIAFFGNCPFPDRLLFCHGRSKYDTRGHHRTGGCKSLYFQGILTPPTSKNLILEIATSLASL